MKTRRLGALALCAALSGCAGTLSVRVDIANPASVQTRLHALQRESECLQAYEERPTQIERNVAEVKDSLFRAMGVLAQGYEARAAAEKDAGFKAQLEGIAAELPPDTAAVGRMFAMDEYLTKRLRIRTDLETLAGSQSPIRALCATPSGAVEALVRERRDAVERFAWSTGDQMQALLRQARNRLVPAAKGDAAAAPPAVVAAQQLAAAATRTAIVPLGDASFARSNAASVVATLDEAEWKQEFNKAFARGVNGNVDIAIIMNDTASFSVKGMRFDASKVAEVARKVTTQSLLVATRIVGGPGGFDAPAPKAGDAAATNAFDATLAPVRAAETTLTQREALLKARKTALLQLADTIAREAQSLTDAADRDRAKKIVGATYTALKPTLALDTY